MVILLGTGIDIVDILVEFDGQGLGVKVIGQCDQVKKNMIFWFECQDTKHRPMAWYYDVIVWRHSMASWRHRMCESSGPMVNH